MGWILLILLGLVVAFAFVFLRFTIVREGTAKVVMRLGKFKKAIMVWEGYILDDKGEVKEGHAFKLLPGGLAFVGFWPIDKVYKYKFRWRDIQLVKGEEQVTFHEDPIDYIFVRPDVYWTDIKAAETAPPERIPVDVQFLVTMRVSHPYKALFRAPSNWNENAMSRLNALLRGWVGTKTVDELLTLKEKPEDIWKEFKDTTLIKKIFKDEWGITVEDNGIEIRTIGLPEEYQEAAAAEKKRRFEAAARAAETVGTVIAMMAEARGKDPSDIQKEIEALPEMRKEFLDLAKDLIVRKLGIEGRSYLDVRVEGAEGLERSLLNALAVWQRMPMGNTGGRPKKPTTTPAEEIEEVEEKRIEKPKPEPFRTTMERIREMREKEK
jgi:regulator of protease activity HflC (stomatin/prohibitin superfamily)